MKLSMKEGIDLETKGSLDDAKKLKSSARINALFIGLMVGIIIYSVWKNGLGFFIIIPLFFIYRIIKQRNTNTLKVIKRHENPSN